MMRNTPVSTRRVVPTLAMTLLFTALVAPMAGAAATAEANARECAALQAQKESIEDRMRAGYRGAEGERMKEQLREISAKIYQLKCRR